MSPGRLEIGEEEGLRDKQIKGTRLVRFCHVLERPVMKAIISDFSLMLSLIQTFSFFLARGDGFSHSHSYSPPGSILWSMIE